MECSNKYCLWNCFDRCCPESEELYINATPNALDCPSSLRIDFQELVRIREKMEQMNIKERLTNKKEAEADRKEYEKRLEQGYPRNIPKERFIKLAEYEDLEEQGLLLKLPCMFGTKIYFVLYVHALDMYYIEKGIFSHEYISKIDEFNKAIFLTREEAEKALEETNG